MIRFVQVEKSGHAKKRCALQGDKGDKGDKGDTGVGVKGDQGVPGVAGAAFKYGSGAPASSAYAVGDVYVNTDNADLYQKTAATVWTLLLNLSSPSSIDGDKTFSGAVTIQKFITPRAAVASSATINSLSSSSPFVCLTGSTATTINGIAAGTTGQHIYIKNRTTAALTLASQSGSAATAAQILTPGDADSASTANSSAHLIYEAGSVNKWILFNHFEAI